MKIVRLEYPSPVAEWDAENDNVDVHAYLDDGRVFSFVVATPNNIFWCMQNEEKDYFFGYPPVFVDLLTPDKVKRALDALVTEDDGRWLEIYGALQQ